MLADLPRLARASRRASTKARLGLCWAVPFLVAVRVAGLLAELLAARLVSSERLAVRALRLLPASFSWHLHLCSGAAAAGAAALASLAASVRLRSLDRSARLPERLSASRRASTSSRLGLATGLALLR